MKKYLQSKSSLVAIAIAAVLSGLAGCATRPPDAAPVQAMNDIPERLSSVIAANGFEHGIRSRRGATQVIDSIYIRISLDSLKRRHYSLDNLIRDLGTVCALPEYSHLPVRIEIAARDAQDRTYVHEALAPAVGGKANIELSVEPDAYNDITITVVRPLLAGR